MRSHSYVLERRYIRDPSKKRFMNNYLNDFNYYNKNNIKMSKIRKENMDEQIKIKHKKETELRLPKMLYSNLFLGSPLPNISLENKELRTKSLNNIRYDTIDNPVPFNNEKYDKNYIKETINLESQEEKLNNSHVGKPMMLFDDILNCVDNLELSNRDDELIRKDNDSLNEVKKKTIEQGINTSDNLIDDKINSRNKSSLQNEGGLFNNHVKMSLATNLTDDSIVQKVLEERRNYKQILHFNDYGKYKFSRKGLNYPETIPENNLPNYTGDDSQELAYYDYRKKVSNPKKIYNSIGSFNTKFNNELTRISRSYGKEESKLRFINNPLINRYQNTIPYYEIYKDIKFVENRYLDKGRYKYKMLPLINSKMRNFDRLGQKIYQMNIQKRNGELILNSIGLDKSKLAAA